MKNGISHILPSRYEISKTHLRALKSGEKILFQTLQKLQQIDMENYLLIFYIFFN